MRKIGSRAQAPSGGNAAILVAVIGSFILLYILFLPKGDQEDLLGTNQISDDDIEAGKVPGAKLLDEQPGTLTKPDKFRFEHKLSAFNLFTKREDSVLKAVDSVFVESGDEGRKSILLSISDDEKIENAKLIFSVFDHSGNLMISLNEKEIFKGEIESFTEPLSLSLKEENLFEFSTDPVPWWNPFGNNFYDLREVKVTATVEKIENKEAIQTFVLAKEEFELLLEASLSYFVECSSSKVEKLTITLNNNLVSSKSPDCGNPERFQIDPGDLKGGKNELKFSSGEGTYIVDRPVIRTELEEPVFPLYFFSINKTVFEKIENNTINSTITLDFLDDDEKKVADIDVNSQKIRINTRQNSYTRNIDNFLIEGTNFIRIVPEDTMHIISMTVLLDCRDKEDCT
jgi:hypothetical protein